MNNNQGPSEKKEIPEEVPIQKEKKQGIPKHVYILIVVAMIMTSFASILIRYAGKDAVDLGLEPADASVIAFWRLFFATIGMFIGTLLTRNLKEFKKVSLKDDIPLLSLSGLLLAIHFTTWNMSLQMTSVANSITIIYLMPFFALILSLIFLKERVSWSQFIAIILALVGAIMVGVSDFIVSDETGYFYGDLLALAGAITGAGYFVIGRKKREKLDVFSYATIVYAFCTLFLLIYVLANPITRGSIISGLKWQHFMFFGLLALGPSCLGHSLYNYSLGYIKAPVITVTALGEMFGATLLAYGFFREVPFWTTFLGMTLVAIGIIITVIFENKAIKEQIKNGSSNGQHINGS